MLLQKCIYPYEYVDGCKKFNETSSSEKKDFYSHLKMEDITNADYTHEKRVCEDFKVKKSRQYHGLYAPKWYIIDSRCI